MGTGRSRKQGDCTRIAAFVRAHRGEIVEAWEAAVAALPHARRLDRPALRDSLPEFLEELGRCLTSEEGRASEVGELATQHAVQRFEYGVDLRHVATEYRLLRSVVLEGYLHACGPEADVREIVRLDDAIDLALVDAVDHYTRARDETREHFIAVLGHDLRNPLGAIRMSASLLGARGAFDETGRALVARIERSSGRIAAMADDLLDLARARLGSGIPVASSPASMEEIVRGVVDELVAAHPGRSITFEARGDARGEWDRERAAQAISNVVANAIEHGEDPVRVLVRGEDDAVRVEVTNAGAPIAPDVLPHLFGRFTRADGARRGSGLGLGLFIANEIVSAHGGTVQARSSPEEGTTFALSWPRRAPRNAREQAASAPHAPRSP